MAHSEHNRCIFCSLTDALKTSPRPRNLRHQRTTKGHLIRMPFHSLPIIYVHEASSFPDELVGSMFTAHIANPDSPIYLITNLKERLKTPSETFDQALVLVDMNAHRPATEALGQVFFNISAMPGSFERMCLDRWFMLRSFVRQMGFSRFFTLDSDVLLF